MSSMDSFASWSSRPVSDLQAQLYGHLAECRQQESTEALLQRFQSLFIEGNRYGDEEIWAALLELIYQPEAEREFKYTLNRCSYTLVNPWYTQPRDHWAIPALVKLFDQIPASSDDTPDAAYRIRQLSQRFTETEQFASLRRLAALFEPTVDDSEAANFENQSVAQQLRHYPFLYDSSLLVTKDSDREQKERAHNLRQQSETKLGIKLARYWAQCRLGTGGSFPNPTRLPDDELKQALEYYTGKVEGNRSHRDIAKMFETYRQTVRSFREFKEEFLEYVLAPLTNADSRYHNNTFTRSLRQFVRETMREFDDQCPKDFTIVTFCRRLLNFLVIHSRKEPIFRRFRQLLNDVGFIVTMGVLLRVVLFCATVKPWLENRMAILFNHHEPTRCGEAPWLIKALEHTNVALITNFNNVGYSF